MKIVRSIWPIIALAAVTSMPAAAQVKIGVLTDMNSLYADITGKGSVARLSPKKK